MDRPMTRLLLLLPFLCLGAVPPVPTNWVVTPGMLWSQPMTVPARLVTISNVVYTVTYEDVSPYGNIPLTLPPGPAHHDCTAKVYSGNQCHGETPTQWTDGKCTEDDPETIVRKVMKWPENTARWLNGPPGKTIVAAAEPVTKPVTLSWDYGKPDEPGAGGPVESLPDVDCFVLFSSTNVTTPLKDWPVLATTAGTNRSVTVDLKPGRYFFYCVASNFWGLASEPSNIAATPRGPTGANITISR